MYVCMYVCMHAVLCLCNQCMHGCSKVCMHVCIILAFSSGLGISDIKAGMYRVEGTSFQKDKFGLCGQGRGALKKPKVQNL